MPGARYHALFRRCQSAQQSDWVRVAATISPAFGEEQFGNDIEKASEVRYSPRALSPGWQSVRRPGGVAAS